MTLTAIDLFSGAGGLSLGFRWAGFDVLAALESNTHAASTYELNHPDTKCVLSRVEDVDPADLMNTLGLEAGELTALIGGPPCQGFSDSNRRTRSLENPINYLYKHYFQFVEKMSPEWFVLENVAGLQTIGKGAILDDILGLGRGLGYVASAVELNAAMYGVPQTRRRVFVVGRRGGHAESILPPPITHGTDTTPVLTVRDAIADLPILANGASVDTLPYDQPEVLMPYQRAMRIDGSTKLTGNLVTNNNQRVLERYRCIRPGQNWSALPAHLMDNYADRSRCHTGIYHRLEWDKPAKVLGNFRKNMLIHPQQDRGLSVREAARMQSFPDWYRFAGSIGLQQQQVGNAVPPLLARSVAATIAESMAKSEAGFVAAARCAFKTGDSLMEEAI